MTMLYQNLCYNEMCNNGTALYYYTLTHKSLASLLWAIGGMRHLIRVITVCLQNVVLKFE